MVDITMKIRDAVNKSGIQNGVCMIYCPHTTAGITINEHADPDVASDILTKLSKLVPYRENYSHLEGNADAHIKSTLVGCSEQVIVENGHIQLGTWQGIFFCEFDGPRSRKIWIGIK
jgi:secondary thiamine-phosphate synthase enzyme